MALGSALGAGFPPYPGFEPCLPLPPLAVSKKIIIITLKQLTTHFIEHAFKILKFKRHFFYILQLKFSHKINTLKLKTRIQIIKRPIKWGGFVLRPAALTCNRQLEELQRMLQSARAVIFVLEPMKANSRFPLTIYYFCDWDSEMKKKRLCLCKFFCLFLFVSICPLIEFPDIPLFRSIPRNPHRMPTFHISHFLSVYISVCVPRIFYRLSSHDSDNNEIERDIHLWLWWSWPRWLMNLLKASLPTLEWLAE